VIFVTRDQTPELRRALTALFAAPGSANFETIVIDCASSDDVRGAAADFPQATFLYLPDNFGATKAMNIAARSAKSSVLFFLAPEVEISADGVLSLTAHLEDNASDTTAVCPLLVDADGAPVGQAQPLPSRTTLARACAGEPPEFETPNPAAESAAIAYMDRRALMVRKQFLQGMNFFDERFGQHWADADLALKIRRAQRKIRLYPSIKAVWHGTSSPASDKIDRADCVLGAAVLLSKYDGSTAGFTFRLARTMHALLHGDFGLFSALVSGEKVGSHAR
jgi:GT2 family glycosyltransferase